MRSFDNREVLHPRAPTRAADAREASGPVTPTVTLSLPPGWQSTQDLVIAPSGDPFTGAWTDGGILCYAAADLDAPAAASAGFVPYPNVATLTWHEGRVYAMQETGQVLLRFDQPGAIVANAVTAPDATVAITGYSGTGSSAGLAFDAAGRLWLAFRQALVRLGGVDASDRFWLADGRDVAGRYPDLGTLAEGATVDPLVTIQHGQFLSAGSLAFHARALGEP